MNGFFFNACPWLEAQEPSVKGLETARKIVITTAYTVLLGLLYLMSTGWQTVYFKINKKMHIILVMLIVFFIYIAYYFMFPGAMIMKVFYFC